MAKTEKNWAKISEAGSLLGMRLLLLVYLISGRWLFRLFLLPVISYFYLSRRDSRKASRDYLARLTAISARQFGSLSSFRHFWVFGEILLDKLLVWMRRIGLDDVVFENSYVFREMDRSKQGGLIVVSHLGNIEVCSALAHRLPDVKITMLVHTHNARKFNEMLKKAGGGSVINLMQVTDITPATAMVLAERVDAGEYVVIAGDRVPINGEGRTSAVEFLGGTAEFPQGAFILASLLRCPVYLMFCLKLDGQYHIYLEPFTARLVFDRKNRGREITATVQQYARRLEHYCYLAPLQWFNFFPFWKQ